MLHLTCTCESQAEIRNSNVCSCILFDTIIMMISVMYVEIEPAKPECLLPYIPVSVVLHMIHIQRTQLAVTVTPAPDLAAHTVSEGLM